MAEDPLHQYVFPPGHIQRRVADALVQGDPDPRAAELLGAHDLYLLELTGKELCQWHKKQTTSAPTRPTNGEPERFQGAWAGIPVDQLKDDGVYRVLPCGGAIWNLAEANLPIRILQYMPADDFFEPARDHFLAANGIQMPDRKPTSQSGK